MKSANPTADVVRTLTALAQETRLKAFRALVVAGECGLTPSELAAALAVPAPTLSFHLKELLVAGLIDQQRQGRHLRYRADFDRMNEVMSFLTEHCCGGRPCGVASSPSAETLHEREDLQRALRVHRQFGALDPG